MNVPPKNARDAPRQHQDQQYHLGGFEVVTYRLYRRALAKTSNAPANVAPAGVSCCLSRSAHKAGVAVSATISEATTANMNASATGPPQNAPGRSK